jgi:hypothetical protein
MSWSKAELIQEAYNELALAGYEFDLTPEEMQAGLRRLDTMLATWNGKGIHLGYPLPSSPGTSALDQDSNLPDWAVEAVYLNLAIRMAPGNGKLIAQDTRTSARSGYDLLLSRAAMPPEQQFKPLMPAGAGNRWRRMAQEPFLPVPQDPLTSGDGDEIEL